MRRILIATIVAVLIVVIAAGYLGYTYLSGQNQNQTTNNPPAQTTNAIENIRDQAMTYLAANHTQTMTLMPTGHWSGGRVDTGLVGAENYLFTDGDWKVGITYPVVPNPIYTVTCNYTAGGGVTWMGTYQSDRLNETNCSLATDTTLTQPQIRDLTMMYLGANHNETTTFMHDMSWIGGRMDMGMMVGSDKYNYGSNNGWNVTIQNPVVPNPPYTVTAVYTPSNMNNAMMTWIGTVHNGTITQTSYTYP